MENIKKLLTVTCYHSKWPTVRDLDDLREKSGIPLFGGYWRIVVTGNKYLEVEYLGYKEMETLSFNFWEGKFKKSLDVAPPRHV